MNANPQRFEVTFRGVHATVEPANGRAGGKSKSQAKIITAIGHHSAAGAGRIRIWIWRGMPPWKCAGRAGRKSWRVCTLNARAFKNGSLNWRRNETPH